mgnify:CR=1 FL=1
MCPEAFILIDVPGIKPRTANTEELNIQRSEVVRFGTLDLRTDVRSVELTKPLPKCTPTLQKFSLNDGQFLFDVTEIGPGYIQGTSRENIKLLPKKGINLPGSVYDDDKQYEVYEKFIGSISDLDVDALGLSFVQNGTLVKKIRDLRPDLVLIAKVENSEGLRNCSEISKVADAVMIDRGDLVAEIGYEHLYSAVEEITSVTKILGKPLIMATENLESMVERELPSKSEVISLAHSADIGTDCFMLSEETALSKNKHIIVNWLSAFLRDLPETNRTTKNVTTSLADYKSDVWKGVSNFFDLPVIIMSKSGRAMSKYLSQAQHPKLFLVTNNKKLAKISSLYRSQITVFETPMSDISSSDFLWKVIAEHKNVIFKESDKVVGIYVSKYTRVPRANTLTIFESDDFS